MPKPIQRWITPLKGKKPTNFCTAGRKCTNGARFALWFRDPNSGRIRSRIACPYHANLYAEKYGLRP